MKFRPPFLKLGSVYMVVIHGRIMARTQTPIQYIKNARTFQGWLKTVQIAVSKCKNLDQFTEIVEACYDKHEYFVYQKGIKYGLASCPYSDVLVQIRNITRTWFEEKGYADNVIVADYGFTHF